MYTFDLCYNLDTGQPKSPLIWNFSGVIEMTSDNQDTTPTRFSSLVDLSKDLLPVLAVIGLLIGGLFFLINTSVAAIVPTSESRLLDKIADNRIEIELLRKDMNSQFEGVNHQFQGINQRLDRIEQLLQNGQS